MHMPSRPFLECHVRRHLQTMGNVTILQGTTIGGCQASEVCPSTFLSDG